MTITVCRDHLQKILAHAERAYPEECCGLLLGTRELEDAVVADLWGTDNTWDAEVACDLDDPAFSTKAHRYWIAPEQMLEAMRGARRQNLEIIGIYHSHPDAPAIPSECDRRLAWQQYSYLIVSLENGVTKDYKSWKLDGQHQFQPENVCIADSIVDPNVSLSMNPNADPATSALLTASLKTPC